MLDVLVSAMINWYTGTISGPEKAVPVNVPLVNVTAEISVSRGVCGKNWTDVWKLTVNIFP